MESPYNKAQKAMAEIKSAIHQLLTVNTVGMKNSEIGRALGIYAGHQGHEGHISRTLLAIMEAEGVVAQDKETKKWSLRTLINNE